MTLKESKWSSMSIFSSVRLPFYSKELSPLEKKDESMKEKIEGFFKNISTIFLNAIDTGSNYKAAIICGLVGILLILVSFLMLPFFVLNPYKFCFCFSLGSLCTMSGIGFLAGPRAFVEKLFSKEKILFTLSYLGSLFLTMYGCSQRHYFVVILSIVIQGGCLGCLLITFIPGGRSGLRLLFNLIPKDKLLPI